MNALHRLLVGVLLVLMTGLAAAEVVIKQEPLHRGQVAGMDGQQLYEGLCASCHGSHGDGAGPAAPALQKVVPDLTQLGSGAEARFSHAQLERVIAGRSRTVHQGIVGMPLWEREFQYVRRSSDGMPDTVYARSRIHMLATHVERLSLAAND